jgi:hypothetical protein
MPRRVLIVGDAGDPLVARMARGLRNPVLCPTPASMSFSFTLDRHGRWDDGQLEIEGTRLGVDDISGIVFRPGAAWAVPRRSRSIGRIFASHETRTAWCALLGAFPGRVIDRLPPGWFLDAARHAEVLGNELARAFEVPAALGMVPQASALLAGEVLMAAPLQPGAARLAAWLNERQQRLRRWQSTTGLQCARIEARPLGDGWSICRVDPVARVDDLKPRTLDDLAAHMTDLLTA